ncbi:chromosome partitioning protein ParB, partial [Bacteroides fragilis]
RFKKEDIYHIGGLDSQKPHKKSIFGSGFLLSEKAATEKAAAEKAAAEKDNIIIWELSEREMEIIKSLGE